MVCLGSLCPKPITCLPAHPNLVSGETRITARASGRPTMHGLGSRHPTHLNQMPSQARLPVTRLLPLRALHRTPRATESFMKEEKGHPKGP